MLVNTPANVTQVTVIQDGNVIDVSVYVVQLNDQIFPQPIQVNQTAPLLPAGTYTFRFLQYNRNLPDTNYLLPPQIVSTLAVTVADPNIVGSTVEYYNMQRNHYFMTSNSIEIAGLDGEMFLPQPQYADPSDPWGVPLRHAGFLSPL
ncbi:MAG TPA: hypothetical protein VMQ50_09235 [Casimicrobiaceae bacterium]|nr:hypothetical protein [Casimicrobiaceae bacterium]